MARQFNVEIILKVLAEGANNGVKLFESLERVANNAAQAVENLQNRISGQGAINEQSLLAQKQAIQASVAGINQIFSRIENTEIGGAKSFQRIADVLAKIKKDADFKVDLNGSASVEELKILQKSLRELLKEAEQTQNVELFQNTSSLLADVVSLRKELEKALRLQNEATRKPFEIRLKVKEFSEVRKTITDIANRFEEATKLGRGVELRKGFTKELNDAKAQLVEIRKAKIAIGEDPIDIDFQIKRIDQLKQLNKTFGVARDRDAETKIFDAAATKKNLSDIQKQVATLFADIKKAEATGNIEIKADLNLRKDEIHQQLSLIKQRVKELNSESKLELFGNLQSDLAKATQSLNQFTAVSASDARNIIRDQNLIEKELNDTVNEIRVLNREVDKARKLGNINLKAQLDLDEQDLRNRLNVVRTSIEKTGDVGKLKIFDNAVAELDAAKRELGDFDNFAAQSARSVISSEALVENQFADVSKRIRQLNRDIQDAKKTGNIELKVQLEGEQIELRKQLDALKSPIENLKKESRLRLFDRASLGLDDARAELQTFTQATVQSSITLQNQAAKLKVDFQDTNSELSKLTQQLKQAKEVGNSLNLKPQLEIDATSVIAQYKKIIEQASELGQDVKPIRVKLEQAERVLDEIEKIDEEVDQINNDKITVKAVLDRNLAKTKAELKELIDEIRKAKEEGNINIIPKLQLKANQVGGQIEGLVGNFRKLGESSKLQQSISLGVDLKSARKDIDGLNKAAGSGLGRTLASLGANVRQAVNSIGGSAGILRGVAGGFRLVGTSAFLVGGQLRGFGFAASAIGNILQNIAPLLIKLVPALGPLGPLALSASVAFTLFAGKVLISAGVLEQIIEAGLKFNSLMEQTLNVIGGIAQEFFTFSKAGKEVGEGLDQSSAITARFKAGQELAKGALESLANEALETNFTTQQLFKSFEATTVALGPLSKGFSENAFLAGQFASLGGLLGISVDNLASSITQLIAGTGRVTNSLQRLFNQTKDSEGIALTAKRIRELRAAGGSRLFDELTTVLNDYTEAAKDAQRQSFQGVFGNFLDLFERFSGASTKNLFDGLRIGFLGLFDTLVKKQPVLDKFGNAVKDLKGRPQEKIVFSESIQKLADLLNNLLKLLGQDLVNAGSKFIGFISSIPQFIQKNYKLIIEIYEVSKDIVKQVISIISLIAGFATTFLRLLGISNEFDSGLNGISSVLKVIRVILGGIQLVLTFSSSIVEGFVAIVTKGVEIFYLLSAAILDASTSLQKFFGLSGDLTSKLADKARDIAAGFGKSADESIARVKQLGKSYKEIISGVIADNDRVKNANPFETTPDVRDTEIDANPNRTDPIDKETLKRSTLRSVLDINKAISDAAQKREENELKLVNERLQQQKQSVEDAIAENVISQQAAANAIARIRQTEIDNEVQQQRNALKLLGEERIRLEKNFQNELDEIRSRELEEGDAADSKARTKLFADLENVRLKRAQERIRLSSEEESIESEILRLEQSRLAIQRDQLIVQIQRSKELRQTIDSLRLSVAQERNATSAESTRLQIYSLIRERIDEIRKLEQEIIDLKSVTATTDLEKKAQDVRIKQSQEALDLIKEEIELKRRAVLLDQTDALANRQKNSLKLAEEAIQRRLNLGLIDERQANIEITAERQRFREGLEEIIKTFEEIDAKNPLNEDQKQKIEELRRSIEELGDSLNEKVLLGALNDTRGNLVTFFDSIQENVGNAKNAFADLGRSILATFRRIISERIVRELFNGILPPETQTQGTTQGSLARILRPVLGIDKDQKQSEEIAKQRGDTLSKDTRDALNEIKESVAGAKNTTVAGIQELNTTIAGEVQPLRDSLNNVIDALNNGANRIREIDLNREKARSEEAIRRGGPLDENQNLDEKIINGDIFGNKKTGGLSSTSGNKELDALILKASKANNVDPTLLTELLRQESINFLPSVLKGKRDSSAGAIGIGQILPSTAKKYGITEQQLRNGLLDAQGKQIVSPEEIGINLSAKILGENLRATGGNVKRALAAYNGGLSQFDTKGYNFGSLERKLDYFINKVPETRTYVSRISSKYEQATGTSVENITGSFKQTYDQLKRTPLPVAVKEVQPSKKGNTLVNPESGLFSFGQNGVNVKQGVQVGAPSLGDNAQLLVQNVEQTAEGFNVTLKNLTTKAESSITGLAQVFVKAGQELETKQLIGVSGANTVSDSFVPTLGRQVVAPQSAQTQIPSIEAVSQASRTNEKLSTITTQSNTELQQINAQVSSLPTALPSILSNDTGFLLQNISQYFTTLGNIVSIDVVSRLDSIITAIQGLQSAGGSQSPDLSGLIQGFTGDEQGFKNGGVVGFISGGAVKGNGGPKDDAVPAFLSNGEYVIQAPIVKALGSSFFDNLNSMRGAKKFATGGPLFRNTIRPDYVPPVIDTTKFNYTDGGASLINKPAPIVEKVAPKKKKVGGFRRFFGNLLSGIAPFLNFIPGIGPFLALGAGAAGGALTGSADGGVGGGILGGVLGGLGNLGGFAGKGGFLGKLGGFFGSKGQGGQLLNIFGGLGGGTNIGGQTGNILLTILKKLGIFNKNNGGLVKGFAKGGFLGGGGGTAILAIASTLLGSLFNRQKPQQQETEFEDPDSARKNRFGSAYYSLIDEGLIPDFKYTQETIDKLTKGTRTVAKQAGGGFGSFFKGILSFLPLILGGLKFGSGGSKGIVDSIIKTGGNANSGVFAKSGGLIQAFADGGFVTGPGTSTSDSIPALLSNKEYVIRASAVRALGTDILDSINAGRFKFAEGGLVGSGVDTLPELEIGVGSNQNSANPAPVVQNNTKIVNVLDPNLVGDFLSTREGERMIMNVLTRNKRGIKGLVS